MPETLVEGSADALGFGCGRHFQFFWSTASFESRSAYAAAANASNDPSVALTGDEVLEAGGPTEQARFAALRHGRLRYDYQTGERVASRCGHVVAFRPCAVQLPEASAQTLPAESRALQRFVLDSTPLPPARLGNLSARKIQTLVAELLCGAILDSLQARSVYLSL